MKSRLTRHTERTMKRNIFLSLAGTGGIVIFLGIFGLPILTNMSIGIDKLRGSSPTTKETNIVVLLPPVFDPIVEATNSGTITITGKGEANMTLLLYVNDTDIKKATIATDGTFSFPAISLKEGSNSLSAKQTDGKANTSELSLVTTVVYKKTKPILEISTPEDNATVTGEKNSISINGKTESDTLIDINGRLPIVQGNGVFTYDYILPEGDTVLKITATDIAGNQTVVERKVTYRK